MNERMNECYCKQWLLHFTCPADDGEEEIHGPKYSGVHACMLKIMQFHIMLHEYS